MLIAVGYSMAVLGFFITHAREQFYLVQNIISDEKITFIWYFVPILATAKQKTKMAADFRLKIEFRPTDPQLLVWQKDHHYMICS